MRFFTYLLALFTSSALLAQTSDTTNTLSILFMGDIMGHDSQINSARQTDGTFDYSEVFTYLKEEISAVDVAIANLEVTLAGRPYKGYPQFSSPNALAIAAQNAGIDILGTANNHSCDRRKQGILRTITVLDSLHFKHTGTYRDKTERDTVSPLIIEKKGFKLALLNYTYGTNGIPVPQPTIVNIIDYQTIQAEIEKAKQQSPDKIIMFIHWGTEYQHQPNDKQKQIAQFCFDHGVDYIIGSHPHTIQKSQWQTDTTQDRFITYSLGNFVSNQRKRYTDGGQMIKLVLKKSNEKVKIIESGFFLTWVYTPVIQNKKHFHILPCAKYELQPDFFITPEHFDKMKLFISDSRNLLNTNNLNVREYLFYNNHWELN